jgi:hypothetical protein
VVNPRAPKRAPRIVARSRAAPPASPTAVANVGTNRARGASRWRSGKWAYHNVATPAGCRCVGMRASLRRSDARIISILRRTPSKYALTPELWQEPRN